MRSTPECILRIRRNYPVFSGKLKTIADFFLDSPEKIVKLKVKEISGACECDDAMVVRFCKKNGYSGFSDFRTSLMAGMLSAGLDFPEDDFASGDSFEKVKRSFLDKNVRALNDSVGTLNSADIGRAVNWISNAARVYLVAVGASGIVAADFHVKLSRMGFNAVFFHDMEFSRLMTGLCGRDDVVAAVSYSGETKSVCDAAASARGRKSRVIGITNFPNSSLARLSDLSLFTASEEKLFRLGAMSSRISQHLVIDFLVLNLALRNFDSCGENILKTHRMISGKRRAKRGKQRSI